MKTLKSTGRSAMILAVTRQAVDLARECPCGREVLAQMLAASPLKGLEIGLCRNGRRSGWLRLLLLSGAVKSVDGNKKRIVVVLESPILMAVARYEREKKRR